MKPKTNLSQIILSLFFNYNILYINAQAIDSLKPKITIPSIKYINTYNQMIYDVYGNSKNNLYDTNAIAAYFNGARIAGYSDKPSINWGGENGTITAVLDSTNASVVAKGFPALPYTLSRNLDSIKYVQAPVAMDINGVLYWGIYLRSNGKQIEDSSSFKYYINVTATNSAGSSTYTFVYMPYYTPWGGVIKYNMDSWYGCSPSHPAVLLSIKANKKYDCINPYLLEKGFNAADAKNTFYLISSINGKSTAYDSLAITNIKATKNFGKGYLRKGVKFKNGFTINELTGKIKTDRNVKKGKYLIGVMINSQSKDGIFGASSNEFFYQISAE